MWKLALSRSTKRTRINLSFPFFSNIFKFFNTKLLIDKIKMSDTYNPLDWWSQKIIILCVNPTDYTSRNFSYRHVRNSPPSAINRMSFNKLCFREAQTFQTIRHRVWNNILETPDHRSLVQASRYINTFTFFSYWKYVNVGYTVNDQRSVAPLVVRSVDGERYRAWKNR